MDQPEYYEEEYPRKFLKGFSIFQDDARIFHRVGYDYDYLTGLDSAHFDGQVLTVRASLLSGEQASLRIESAGSHILRIRFWQGDHLPDDISPMLLPQAKNKEQPGFSETATSYAFTTAGYTLYLDKRPFCLRLVSPAGETIFISETERLVGLYTAPPLGWRRRGEEKWAFLSWHMRNQDRFFGLGEKFTRFEKTSTRATIWQEDTCGSNTSDLSYKAVPLLLSTAGWALLLHTSRRSYWEIGSFSYATGSTMVEDSSLDLFFLLSPTLKGQVTAYTALTGRPQMPPRWALGLWMSRAAYRNRAEMEEVADRLRAEGIPCDVFNIDPTWLKRQYYDDIGVEVCNLDWDDGPWGPPEKLFADFAAKGYNICLWMNPYFSEDSEIYAEAKEKGYLVKNRAGGISRLEYNLAAGIIDLTNPAARSWWQDKLATYLRKGAAVYKVDFGDRIPEDALFFNGKTGKEMHNLYVHLYAEAVYEVVRNVHGVGMIWRRPGYIGSQRFPGCWAGDTQVTWEGMKGALRGGLSAAMSGEAFWGHDIGGFVGAQPSNELYIRWVQFGLLSPLSRFHGTTPREPWHYSPEAVEVVRYYSNLRYRLIPYLLAAAQESVASGLPILRPMVLEFPDEPMIDQIDDQYMLGPDLLVAPVFVEGARWRWVYFPQGKWWPLDGPGEDVTGPGFRRVAAPLERAPLYARSGAVIPSYVQAPPHLKAGTPREWYLDIYAGAGKRRLTIPEDAFTLQVEHESDGRGGYLRLSPAPITLTVRLWDVQPSSARLNGVSSTFQPGDRFAWLRVEAGPGVELLYSADK